MFDSLRRTLEVAEAELRKIDPKTLIGNAPAEGVDLLIRHQRITGAVKLALIARTEEMHQWEREGYRDFADWLAAREGTSKNEARRKTRTAKNLSDNDEVADALADGEISEDQADVVADAAAKNPDAQKDLLDTAKNDNKTNKELRDKAAKAKASSETDEERARRLHKGRSAGWGLDRDGFWSLRGKFAPQVGAELKARLEAEVEAIFEKNRRAGTREHPDRYRADAIAATILGDRSPTTPDARPPATPTTGIDRNDGDNNASAADTTEPATSTKRRGAKELVLDINLETYRRGGVLSGETCAIRGVGPVPVEVAHEWAEDAFIKVVLRDGKDIKLIHHLGRNVNVHLKTALDFIEPTCAVPRCDNERLEYDHHNPHANLGPTSWSNLRRPCHTCHQLITHKGYRLEGDRGDRIWIHPDGRILRADNADLIGQIAPPTVFDEPPDPACATTPTEDSSAQLNLLDRATRAP